MLRASWTSSESLQSQPVYGFLATKQQRYACGSLRAPVSIGQLSFRRRNRKNGSQNSFKKATRGCKIGTDWAISTARSRFESPPPEDSRDYSVDRQTNDLATNSEPVPGCFTISGPVEAHGSTSSAGQNSAARRRRLSPSVLAESARSEKHANFQPADRRVTDTTTIIIDLIVQDKKQGKDASLCFMHRFPSSSTAASCSLTLTAAPHPSYLPCPRPRPRPRLLVVPVAPSSSGSPHPSAQSPSS
uniref:Uncharacterized protein n=1 Tax=Coccidioides posadasii RMSCC 3488 TaxID=454284 RepID=A0A0J6EXW0_COCPO|nr:hypothetical protein CPAG_01757 [Coccidioides posadasii RMSCC 3488]